METVMGHVSRNNSQRITPAPVVKVTIGLTDMVAAAAGASTGVARPSVSGGGGEVIITVLARGVRT